MGKNKSKRKNIVYSTNPDYDYDDDGQSVEETLPEAEQKLYVSIDRKMRKGKSVTLIEGFVGSVDDLKELSKKIKDKRSRYGAYRDRALKELLKEVNEFDLVNQDY